MENNYIVYRNKMGVLSIQALQKGVFGIEQIELNILNFTEGTAKLITEAETIEIIEYYEKQLDQIPYNVSDYEKAISEIKNIVQYL